MFAHAADQQQIGELPGNRKQTGYGFRSKVDKRFIHNDQFHVPGSFQELEHGIERKKLAGRISRVDDQQRRQSAGTYPANVIIKIQAIIVLGL